MNARRLQTGHGGQHRRPDVFPLWRHWLMPRLCPWPSGYLLRVSLQVLCCTMTKLYAGRAFAGRGHRFRAGSPSQRAALWPPPSACSRRGCCATCRARAGDEHHVRTSCEPHRQGGSPCKSSWGTSAPDHCGWSIALFGGSLCMGPQMSY